MTPKQIARLEDAVIKMAQRTANCDNAHPDEWVDVQSNLEALSMSLQAWRHAKEASQ